MKNNNLGLFQVPYWPLKNLKWSTHLKPIFSVIVRMYKYDEFDWQMVSAYISYFSKRRKILEKTEVTFFLVSFLWTLKMFYRHSYALCPLVTSSQHESVYIGDNLASISTREKISFYLGKSLSCFTRYSLIIRNNK